MMRDKPEKKTSKWVFSLPMINLHFKLIYLLCNCCLLRLAVWEKVAAEVAYQHFFPTDDSNEGMTAGFAGIA